MTRQTPVDITPPELRADRIQTTAREGWVVDLATDPTQITDWPARQAAPDGPGEDRDAEPTTPPTTPGNGPEPDPDNTEAADVDDDADGQDLDAEKVARPVSVFAGPDAAAVLAVGFGDVVGEPPKWQERALCAQTDPEAFFPEKGGSTREAKRICLGCEVRTECLQYALANDERFGIWGGMSERERRRYRRQAAGVGAGGGGR